MSLGLKTEDRKRSKQYWKFNNPLLKDTNYIMMIKQLIHDQKYALPLYNFDEIDDICDEIIEFQIYDQLFFEVLLVEKLYRMQLTKRERKLGWKNNLLRK